MAKENKKKSNDLAVLGLVFAIFYGFLGIIFSIMGLNQIKKTGEPGKGFAIAGIIIGIINTLATILLVVFLFAVIITTSNASYNSVDNMSDWTKCNSVYTTCSKSNWYCEEYGCYCTYDDGRQYDYFYCDSYDFD
jgi:hypothetical protein